MEKRKDKWLVRTRAGEILGPYSQNELIEELRKHTFSVDDEMAPTEGYWIPAQNLSHRDSDEFTRTSTRSQTLPATDTPVPSAPIYSQDSAAREITHNPDSDADSNQAPDKPSPKKQDPEGKSKQSLQSVKPIIIGIIAMFSFWTLWLLVRPTSPQRTGSSPTEVWDRLASPILQEVDRLMLMGKGQRALQLLTDYHNKNQMKGNLDYLVPYASLLITENESYPRAKKLLNIVIESEEANPFLKSEAYMWLGYAFLSRDEGDMGESHFLDALQLNEKDTVSRFNLGRAYLKQENFQKALEYFKLTEVELPNFWLNHIYKGRAYASLGKMDDAQYAFQTAILTSKDRWISYIYYSLFLMGVGRSSLARNTLMTMITRDPTYELLSPPPRGYFQEEVNYDEYLNAFLEVTRNGPRTDQDFGRLYLSYLGQGATASKDRLMRMADRGGLTERVIALKVLLDTDAPKKELAATLQKLPDNLIDFGYYGYVLRAQAFIRLRQPKLAEKDLKSALALEPKTAITRLTYANLMDQLNMRNRSKNEISQLLTYHPHYIPAIVSAQKR